MENKEKLKEGQTKVEYPRVVDSLFADCTHIRNGKRIKYKVATAYKNPTISTEIG